MPASLQSMFRTEGFTVLPALAKGPALERLRAAAGRLDAAARDQTESTDDIILEAEGRGGWAAWQRGDAALRGVLRSVSNAHRHEPDLLAVASDLNLADQQVSPVVDGAPVSVVNVFLWAKAARVGSEKPWHQDMAFAPVGFTHQHRNVVTVWIALDPATERNGCLEFVPGSHLKGKLPHVEDDELPTGAPRAEHAVEPHVELDRVLPGARRSAVPLDPGSAVMFDGLTLHRSATNSALEPRRAISYVYAVG